MNKFSAGYPESYYAIILINHGWVSCQRYLTKVHSAVFIMGTFLVDYFVIAGSVVVANLTGNL
jgi:hypothetical protein